MTPKQFTSAAGYTSLLRKPITQPIRLSFSKYSVTIFGFVADFLLALALWRLIAPYLKPILKPSHISLIRYAWKSLSRCRCSRLSHSNRVFTNFQCSGTSASLLVERLLSSVSRCTCTGTAVSLYNRAQSSLTSPPTIILYLTEPVMTIPTSLVIYVPASTYGLGRLMITA